MFNSRVSILAIVFFNFVNKSSLDSDRHSVGLKKGVSNSFQKYIQSQRSVYFISVTIYGTKLDKEDGCKG